MTEYVKSMRKNIGHERLLVAGASVFIHKDGKLLLQKRKDNGCWSEHGGCLELGETFEETARRELFEETGLVAGDLELLGIFSGEELFYTYPNGDMVSNVGVAYLCDDFTGGLIKETNETSDLQWFSLDELPKIISPPIKPALARCVEVLKERIKAGNPERDKKRLEYVRIQGRETAYRTGMPVGIFAAVHRLQEAGLLTQEEKAVYHEIDQVWFQNKLPNPPFYDDDKPGKPITWFKTATAGFMIDKLRPLMDMLEKYAKPYDIVYTNSPGRVVYEDDWQVAVYSDEGPGQISPLSVEHLPIYAEVIRQSFTTVAMEFDMTKENCPTHTSFITDERLKSRIKDGYYPYGYFTNGKLVGFVSLTDMGGYVYELNNLAVLPEARHFGYGKALLGFCKNKVRELGGTKITIGIIEEHTVLKDWYAANGFTHIGTKKFEHLPFTAGYMELSV